MRRSRCLLALLLGLITILVGTTTATSRAVMPDPWERWIEELQDSHWQIANEAMTQLQAAGPEVLDRLLPLFRNELPSVRYRAVEIVGSFGPPAQAAVPFLEELQWDEALHVAAAAGRALAAISEEFPSAQTIRLYMAAEYPWLLDRPLRDILYFEAIHGNAKILGFGSHAYAVDYPSDEAAFFMFRRTVDGHFDMVDLTASIDSERVYYRTRNLYLPDQEEPAILLTSSYFNDDLPPMHYVIAQGRVLLQTSGEHLRWFLEPVGPVLDLISVMETERVQQATAWDVNTPLPPPSGMGEWTAAEVHCLLPYVRRQYWYDSRDGLFHQDEASPLTFWAAVVLLLERLPSAFGDSNALEGLKPLLAPELVRSMISNKTDSLWYVMERLRQDRFLVQGLVAPNILQLLGSDSVVVHLLFDRPWSELYPPRREDRNGNPWIEGPLITDIRLLKVPGETE